MIVVQPHQNFAIEASYAYLGKMTGQGSFLGSDVDISAESTAFTLQTIGILPVSDSAELLFKVGAVSWRTEMTATGGVRDSERFTGTDWMVGMGTICASRTALM